MDELKRVLSIQPMLKNSLYKMPYIVTKFINPNLPCTCEYNGCFHLKNENCELHSDKNILIIEDRREG